MDDTAPTTPQDSPSRQPMLFDMGYVPLLANWQSAVLRSLLLIQGEQLQMMAAWQRSVGAAQRDLMDRWICRFGGGVPLDG